MLQDGILPLPWIQHARFENGYVPLKLIQKVQSKHKNMFYAEMDQAGHAHALQAFATLHGMHPIDLESQVLPLMVPLDLRIGRDVFLDASRHVWEEKATRCLPPQLIRSEERRVGKECSS